MDAILILLIISVQFSVVYFGVKYLSELNEKIILLNEKVIMVNPIILSRLTELQTALKKINIGIDNFINQQNKIKLFRNIMLIKSLFVAIILFKKRKSLMSFFSLYNVVSQFVKSLVELK